MDDIERRIADIADDVVGNVSDDLMQLGLGSAIAHRVARELGVVDAIKALAEPDEELLEATGRALDPGAFDRPTFEMSLAAADDREIAVRDARTVLAAAARYLGGKGDEPASVSLGPREVVSRPVTAQAVQWDGTVPRSAAILEWIRSVMPSIDHFTLSRPDPDTSCVHLLEFGHEHEPIAQVGDWILFDPQHGVRVLRPETFEREFEEA